MKKFTILAVNSLLLCLTIALQAQQITLSNVLYDSLQIGIKAHSVVATNDNGYIIVGEAVSQKGLIVKVDSMGNLLWNKTIDNHNTNIFPDVILNNIISTNDSCYVIVGEAFNAITGVFDACCIKINSIGDTLWSKVITCNGNNSTALSVQQTNDAGYILTGNAYLNNTGDNKIFATKLNFAGNLEWTNILTGGNNSISANSVKQTTDSGYVIIGYMENISPYDPNAFLLKLSSNGVLSWANKYYFASADYCSGNDVIISDNGFLCYLNTGYATTLMKTDFLGNILGIKSYYGSSGYLYYGNPTPKLHKALDNGYVFVNGTGNVCESYCELIKTDSTGILSWSKTLFLGAVDLIESEKKELLIVGNGPLCAVKSPQVFSPQIGIIKTDSLGNAINCVSSINLATAISNLISSSATFTALSGATENTIYPGIGSIGMAIYPGCVDIIGGIHESKLDNVISVYPNPSNGIFKFQSNESKPYQINVYNTLGEKIYQTGIKNQECEIDLSFQPRGIYFYQAIFSNNIFAAGKLIIK